MKKMTTRFEIDYKERLEQSRKAKSARLLPRLGYAPYRVYEVEQPKKELTFYGSSTGTGKSSYNMNISKSRQTGKTQWQQVIYDYLTVLENIDSALYQPYEVQWLKPKQATMLRLKGHRVEPTTADDKSTVGSVRLGK